MNLHGPLFDQGRRADNESAARGKAAYEVDVGHTRWKDEGRMRRGERNMRHGGEFHARALGNEGDTA